MRIIKRYSNRKLYDTAAKRYVTLEALGDIIREQGDVRVLDHSSGQDITALIQAQVIFELERKLKGGVPRSILTGVIQKSSDTFQQLRNALHPSDWNSEVEAEIERRIRLLIALGELSETQGLRLLDKLLAAGEPELFPAWINEAELERALAARGTPTRSDLQRLSDQLGALADELNLLGKKKKRNK